MDKATRARMALSTLMLGLGLLTQANAQTTAKISVNIWCNRTTGMGHDAIVEKAAFIGNWSDGTNIKQWSWNFGGWTINDRGGFNNQGHTHDIFTMTMYPGQDMYFDYALVAQSDWLLGDIIKGAGIAADTLFPEYTYGTAAAATKIATGMLTGQGTVGSLRAHVVCDANGHMSITELTAFGNAADRGGDPGGFHAFGFSSGRAEYFIGLRVQ